MADRDQFLLGGDLIDRLAPMIGVDGSKVRQIIIVADYDSVALVYIEMLGTEKLLELQPQHLEHAKIKIIGGGGGD